MTSVTYAEAKAGLQREDFASSGKRYALLNKKVKWPRLKGPKGIRVDVVTKYAVGFVN